MEKMKWKKKLFALMVALIVVVGFSVTSHATLFNRGTDSLGNKLIYDDDLNITWYDYTNSGDAWENQLIWADNLTVDFDADTHSEWRLSETVQIDAGCVGWYCDEGEMGHLYYDEFMNNAPFGPLDTTFIDGSTGDMESFQNVVELGSYWTGTEFDGDLTKAWVFGLYDGYQNKLYKGTGFFGMAVCDGDVANGGCSPTPTLVIPERPVVTPEPSTYLLLGSGIAGLVLWRRKRKA